MEDYVILKQKLEALGYNNTLPLEAVPLVECIVADLLQTTRSLQNYMELSKDALIQRDSLILSTEPYKSDNIRLIKENNCLHQENILLKEDNLRLKKDNKHKIRNLTEELSKKELLISNLQHDIRDLSLRGLCADTLSSRNKKKQGTGEKGVDNFLPKLCMCNENSSINDVSNLKKNIQSLQAQIEDYVDEVNILKGQIQNRDSEILRLNMLLEGGRPISTIIKDTKENAPHQNTQKLIKDLKELEIINEKLRKEMDKSLEKQHEAMLRALALADKNKILQEEILKVDKLALKVETECNQNIATMSNKMALLQNNNKDLNVKNSKLEQELSNKNLQVSTLLNGGAISNALKEKYNLQKEIGDLIEYNKNLQENISLLSQTISNFHLEHTCEKQCQKSNPNSLFKVELKTILGDERKKYETCLIKLQEKLNETINLISKQVSEKESRLNCQQTSDNFFVRDLHVKLCEHEHRILMLKKENEDLKFKINSQEDCDRNKFQSTIKHLNLENTELSKENILLSKQLSQHKAQNDTLNRGDSNKQEIEKLQYNIDKMSTELKLLHKDKCEYISRYKEAMELVEKLKQDIIMKQKDIENLEEENCSYKISNRSGKAKAEHMIDECNSLKEQLQKLKNDIIREKTVSNQIKNIQLETERSSTEIQNELLNLQKKLSLSNDTITNLEATCKKLQSEIDSLQSDKSNLLENIKIIDQNHDKVVMELDNKTELVNTLEEKVKSQTHSIGMLQSEVIDLKRQLNINRVSEHKIVDYESQIKFLNDEIVRLTKQYDLAIMENKRLQNNLADASGTLKLTKIELEKSKHDVDSLKQQLQHYVAEIRRIEELLSEKEAERSDMLEQFASLSVEANILENTNHSLESEAASKSQQLQTYVNKIHNLENKLLDKDNIIDSQSARIAAMTCKLTTLENDVKLLSEEKLLLEQNISYLKQKCNTQQNQTSMTRSINDLEQELKLYENKIKAITHLKKNLHNDNDDLKRKLSTTEKLLKEARREVVDLKLALQDANEEIKSLKSLIKNLDNQDSSSEKLILSKGELEFTVPLEDRIEEVSNEDDISEQSNNYDRAQFKYGHSSTM